MRPLLFVENNKLPVIQNGEYVIYDSFDQYVSKGMIEYLDVEEEETAMICMNIRDLKREKNEDDNIINYTHCEIHPSLMLGICASIIPFPDHN